MIAMCDVTYIGNILIDIFGKKHDNQTNINPLWVARKDS